MEEIKQKLLEMQSAILADLELDRESTRSAISGDIGDEIDYANEDRNRELYQLLCERDQKKLVQIREALEAIDDKTYGTCEECGVKIGKKRLLALPFTNLCIECKSEEERTRGTGRSSEIRSYSGSDTGEL